MKKVVILLNMGGPNNLDEVEVFLKNMFNDRYILDIKSDFLRKLIAFCITKLRLNEAKNNYKAIGSKSRIADITDEICKKLNENSDIKFDFAMNYTAPFFKDVILKYKDYCDITLFPLYPHHSKTTFVSSVDSAKKIIKELNISSNIRVIDFFYKDFKYNQIIINSIKKSMNNLNYNDFTLLFSAHSLPVRTIKKGDKYQKHIMEHFEILKSMLSDNNIKFNDVILSYQSKLGPIEWLGPSTDDVIKKLDNKNLIIYPLSFCVDNSETDFELNIQYRNLSKELEFENFIVCECPNSNPDFLRYLQDKVNL